MEQHPVPTDITGFKFKLVGDMTLKQFGELAFGAIVAYLFYATGWPGFIRLPLTIIFALFGFALAFFPIEERPLDIWIVNFLKAIYRPTLYVWQKNAGTISFTTPPVISATPTTSMTPSWKPPTEPRVVANAPQRVSPVPPSEGKGSLSIEDLQKLRDQKLSELEGAEKKLEKVTTEVKTDIYQAKNEPQIVTVDSLAMRRDEKKQADETQMRGLIEQNNALMTQIETVKTKIQALQGMDSTQLQEQLANLSAQRESLGTQINDLKAQLEKGTTPPIIENVGEDNIKIVEKSASRQATISLTDIPNIINGLILNEKGIPLENTILIIKDKAGNSIRALKSNQVGQFIASTPLENGTYYLEFERNGYTFDILEITLSGKVIPPLEIKARLVNTT